MQILSCMYALYTQWDHAVHTVSSTVAVDASSRHKKDGDE